MSTVEDTQLEDFVAKGRQPRAVAHWRAFSTEHKEPQPEAGEIVSFLTFHEHGFGYSAHPFLLRLLNKWEVEL
ncbi:hypothetical protein C2845_PM16G07610 [Panicum miliaceum]|uniref:Uncharacterized protein n=1 Tax=Panicum miliaceum TaxID=4540 RepID=A0A3L6PYN1_PANMI|nr:hypothetical protein C2845_PM16G07610 [Panicum miliaceum]